MKIDADTQDTSPVTLAAARAEFAADVTYLDTATFGLPPRRSWAALQQALAQWRAGTADAVAYDLPLAAARSSYARLAGVDPSVVAVGSQVSVFAGLIRVHGQVAGGPGGHGDWLGERKLGRRRGTCRAERCRAAHDWKVGGDVGARCGRAG